MAGTRVRHGVKGAKCKMVLPLRAVHFDFEPGHLTCLTLVLALLSLNQFSLSENWYEPHRPNRNCIALYSNDMLGLLSLDFSISAIS